MEEKKDLSWGPLARALAIWLGVDTQSSRTFRTPRALFHGISWTDPPDPPTHRMYSEKRSIPLSEITLAGGSGVLLIKFAPSRARIMRLAAEAVVVPPRPAGISGGSDSKWVAYTAE